MKKLFTLLMLLVAIVTGAKADAVTASWLAPSNNMNLTGSTTSETLLSVSDGTYSSALKHVATWSKNSTYYYTFDRNDEIQDKKGTINESRYVDFVATVPAGYNFTLTKIEAVGVGVGTGNNSWRVDYYKPGESTGTTIAPAAQLGSGSESTASVEPITDNVYSEGQTIKIRVYVGINNTGANKDVGLRDVKIIGTSEVASTDPVPASITTQPSDIEANVGVEATLSVTAAGYPTPSYQWYSCDDADKTNAQPIEGATSASYSFTPEATGNLYFYVTVQNENNTQAVVSNVATVTVSAGQTEAPTFTVYGNTVQLESKTEGATIYYELDNPDVKTSENKIEYTGTFIPTASGTIYAYAEKTGFNASDVASKQVTLSTVGDVVGDLIATVQAAKGAETTTFGNVTVTSPESPAWDGRGVYPEHMKVSGTVTLTASNGATIQSIKIYGTSNDGSKVATITAGEGATVITTPAEIMPRDVTVGGEQVMSEVVITVDAPEANNSISFTLGRESRLYIEVYGAEVTENIEIDASGVATYVTKHALDFSTINGAFKAYVPTSVNEAKTSVATAEVTSVPAGTAVLLKGAEGSYDVEIAESATAPAANLFQVSDGSVAGGDDIFAYSKTNKKFQKVNASVTIPAGKCYLVIEGVTSTPGAPASLDIDFEGEATAVDAIAEADANSAAPVKVIKNGKLYIGNYNVAGQQVK